MEKASGKSKGKYAVSFYCKPGAHWRPCTEIVEADSLSLAVGVVMGMDLGMPIDGPFRVHGAE